MYISKGTVISPSTEGLLFVVRGGVKFQLTGQEAALWLNGRFQFVDEKTEDERRCLKKLKRMGLAETSQSQSDTVCAIPGGSKEDPASHHKKRKRNARLADESWTASDGRRTCLPE